MRIEIIGEARLMQSLDGMAKAVPWAAMKGVKQAAQAVKGTSQSKYFRDVSGPATGTKRVKIAGRWRKVKTYGSMGLPVEGILTVRTGNLRRSIKAQYDERKLTGYVGVTEVGAKVASTMVYGRQHELGEGVPPRPFLAPALRDERDNIRKLIANAIKSGIAQAIRR